MRIATYNVNGIKARIERLVDWLGRARPDVVCQQELKSED
ncbi:MAG: endonuclease/exonuclease/phosphatase family protein, partial [Gemmobacter sp.]